MDAGDRVHLLPARARRVLPVGRGQRAAGRHDLRHLRAQAEGGARPCCTPGPRAAPAGLLRQPVHPDGLPPSPGRARQDHQHQHALLVRLPEQLLPPQRRAVGWSRVGPFAPLDAFIYRLTLAGILPLTWCNKYVDNKIFHHEDRIHKGWRGRAEEPFFAG